MENQQSHVEHNQSGIIFTNNAIKEIGNVLKDEKNTNLKIRAFVMGGGCSGFQYGFSFEEAVNEDDSKFLLAEQTETYPHKIECLVDSMSFAYLDGAKIDYVEDAEGAKFVVENPNATQTCGCGSSFSV